MAGDEFDDDDIDWAALDLPPSSGPSQAKNHISSTTSQHNDVFQPQSEQNQAVNNSNIDLHANPGTAISTSRNNISEKPTTTYLQNQITHLQSLLASKASRISELETTAASTLAAQKAETDARNRIHLLEEELRRTKREADQYKGQWVRVKKRVADLEQNAQGQVERNRAITPNVDHFHHHFGDEKEKQKDDKMEVEKRNKGLKRKSEEHENDGGSREKQENLVVSWEGVTSQILKHTSVRERVAKHLLLLDESDKYSLINIIKYTDKKGESKDSQSRILSDSTGDQVEHETKQFVKSILCHMATGPMSTQNNNSCPDSVSGLVRILLERFNTLFYPHDATSIDSTESDVDQSEHIKQYRDIFINVVSNGKQVNYATHSSKAVLYLLHLMHDILLLSASARDHLRWWFYKARRNEDAEEDSNVDAVEKSQESRTHPRIEGLPSNINMTQNTQKWSEALWNTSCQPIAEEHSWHALTMAAQCNAFFEILVGLMRGAPQTVSQGDHLNKNYTVLEYAQLKSIEFVSCLMSDAPPCNHFGPNAKIKTPYIWTFWFDSLFPSYSPSSIVSDSSNCGDFFSIWEISGGSHRKKFLGKGRRYNTQLVINAVKSEDVSTKQNGGKQSSRVGKSKSIGTTPPPHRDVDCLIVNVKCKSLQLMTHFISSSTSLHQSIYNVHSQSISAAKGTSLAKRILFAVLDDLDEFAIPLLISSHNSKENPTDFIRCLELCHSCVKFLLVLSQSDAGIHISRIQTKLDIEVGDSSRWSSSAIGCVTALLDALLLRIDKFGDHQYKCLSDNRTSVMRAIVENCILFYKNLLSFVHNQSRARSKSKTTSMLALVAEQRNVFVSCCHKVISMQGLNEDIKYEARLLLEEVLLDEEE